MKVIIPAAGIGSRFRDVCSDIPKPLFQLKGKSLLEYSLDSISAVGLRDVIIVIGYMGEKIKEKFGRKHGKIKINYAVNKLYKTTGSMYSIYSSMKTPEDCLILDADIIYSGEIINKLVENKYENVTFLTQLCGSGEETYALLDKNQRLCYLRLNKNIDKNLKNRHDILEFVGVSKFSKYYISEMMKLYKEKLRNNNGMDNYYEEIAFNISDFLPWYGFTDNKLPFAEIDKKNDIERALNVLERIGL